MRIFLFIAVLISVLPFQVQAQESRVFVSSAYLHKICERNDDRTEVVKGGHTACQAYISGVIDYHNLLKSLGTEPSIKICITNAAKLSDLQDVVWNYIDKNAQHDAFAAAPTITLALAQVFPCKKKR